MNCYYLNNVVPSCRDISFNFHTASLKCGFVSVVLRLLVFTNTSLECSVCVIEHVVCERIGKRESKCYLPPTT
jgi:hypothetical protein